VLCLALVVQVPAVEEARPAPPRPGLSWEEADVVTRTLRRIDRRLRSGRPAAEGTVVLTERQINSFVNLSLGDRIPPEVSDFELRLLPGRLIAHAVVDLDRLKDKLPEGTGLSLLSLLSGPVPVDLRGRLEGADGMGRFALEEATVSGVGVPPSVLSQLVSLATRTVEHPTGLDIAAPLPLPWTARGFRLDAGRLLVDFR
jgi:hypothetical protein